MTDEIQFSHYPSIACRPPHVSSRLSEQGARALAVLGEQETAGSHEFAEPSSLPLNPPAAATAAARPSTGFIRSLAEPVVNLIGSFVSPSQAAGAATISSAAGGASSFSPGTPWTLNNGSTSSVVGDLRRERSVCVEKEKETCCKVRQQQLLLLISVPSSPRHFRRARRCERRCSR